jgi:hypothetical protein
MILSSQPDIGSAKSFLSSVWGADDRGNLSGVHFISSLKPTGGVMQHYPVSTLDDAITQAATISEAGLNAYFACAKFLTPDNRKARNTTGAKVFWFDIDCGEDKAIEGKGYATQNDGVQALGEFLKLLGLAPDAPWTVDSGHGIHAYLQLDVELGTEEWQLTAGKLKQLAANKKFLADPSRTADIASVLRVPGTFNYKNPADPKVVVLKHAGYEICYTELKAALDRELESASQIVVPQQRTSTVPMLAPPSYPESSFDLIRQRCPTLNRLAEYAEAGNQLSEPTWRNMLGLVKHTTEGEALGHELSRHDPRYDYTETQSKMDRWTAGPTLCASFRTEPLHDCSGCTNLCKSPISLGHHQVISLNSAEPLGDVISIVDSHGDVLSGRVFARIWINKFIYVANSDKWLHWKED